MTEASTVKVRRPWGAALLAAIAVSVIFLVPGLAGDLEYTREAVAGGQVWRLVTCHLTHWTAEHLLWDLAAFALLLIASLRVSSRQTMVVLAVSALTIPAGVWLMLPDMMQYRGLSGVDSALFLFLAIHTAKTLRARPERKELIVVYGLMVAFALKTAFELTTGETVFVSSMGENVVGVPLAHMIGALAGCLPHLASAHSFWTSINPRRKRPDLCRT